MLRSVIGYRFRGKETQELRPSISLRAAVGLQAVVVSLDVLFDVFRTAA